MNTASRGSFDASTEQALGAVFEVSNTLGAGFLEKVNRPALLHELPPSGIRAAAEVSFPVRYKGHGVGEYFAGLLVVLLSSMSTSCQAISGRCG